MYEQARAKVYWKNMELDIKNYVKSCHECQKFRGHVQKPSKLLSFPIPESPWQRVHMDLLTSFNETRRGFKNILVIVDTLSRYVELIPLKSKTAYECATSFYRSFICRYGLPETIVTDNGTEFRNAFYDRLTELFKIKKG